MSPKIIKLSDYRKHKLERLIELCEATDRLLNEAVSESRKLLYFYIRIGRVK